MNLEFLKNKFKEHPIAFLAWVGMLFLIIATYYKASTLPGIQTKYNELLHEQQLVEYNILNATGLDEDLKKLNTLTQAVRLHFIDPVEKASNFRYFFSLEEKTEVKISNPRLGSVMLFGVNNDKIKDLSQPALAVTQYTLNVEGTFNQFLKLIYELEVGPLLARIDRCVIDVGKNVKPDGLSGIIEVSFLGNPD